MNKEDKIVCWFSAGVTSAVATKMIVDDFGVDAVEIIFFETGSHHPDTERFLKDCEKWYGKEIWIVQNPEFANVMDVLELGYINSPHGAFCTHQLKKKMRWELEKEYGFKFQVFGFEYSPKEINRAVRFIEQYPDVHPIFPLIEKKITKPKAFKILEEAGIEMPEMYKLGYHNNNCIMCVKGGMGYFNKMRKDFPEHFEAMAKLERKVGATCLKEKDPKTGKSKKLYLDQLHPNRGHDLKPITSECGVVCATEFNDIMSPETVKILAGKKKLADVVRERYQ
jgi:3'-phosphoadenosine 5'-phosphosulfate sulfotransferase (PAPS reductase)/FAD synthetase